VVMVIAFALFARGIIVLSDVFGNPLLKIIASILIVAMVGLAVLDVTSLLAEDFDSVWIANGVAAVRMGVLSIIFGISLIRLQDGMGELSRVAGILEIV